MTEIETEVKKRRKKGRSILKTTKYRLGYFKTHPKKRVIKKETIERAKIRKARHKYKKAKEGRPEPPLQEIRVKPLLSAEDAKRTRQEINNTNRRRSKDMERRIAKYLKGTRVLLSGAMAGDKGDCKIPLQNGRTYLVECKLSAARDVSQKDKRNFDPYLTMQIAWLSKIQRDARSMNCQFGVLVVHYHGVKDDYIFVPRTALLWIHAHHNTLGKILDIPARDISMLKPDDFVGKTKKKESVRKTIKLYRSLVEEWLTSVDGVDTVQLLTPFDYWYMFRLEQWRDIIEGV